MLFRSLILIIAFYGCFGIEVKPGNVKGSYQLPGGDWACPIQPVGLNRSADVPNNVTIWISKCVGGFMKGGITYETCTLKKTLILFQNDNSRIAIGADEDYFDTVGLIRYIANKVCISWRDVQYQESDRTRATAAACKNACLENYYAPAYTLTQFNDQGKATNYESYTFEKKSTSAGNRIEGMKIPALLSLFILFCFL